MLGVVRAHQRPTPKRLLVDKPLSYIGGMSRLLVLYLGSAAMVARRFSLSALQDRLVEFDIDYFGATDGVAKLPDHAGIAKLRMAWISIAGLSKGLHEPLERSFAPVRRALWTHGNRFHPHMNGGHTHDRLGSCGVPGAARACASSALTVRMSSAARSASCG